ncbi:MAG TPA: DUF255 domain-containing protein [bacterium]
MENPSSNQPLPSGSLKKPTPVGMEWWCYLIGFLSLVPFVGVMAALISIILGLIKIRQGGWKLFLLAFLGMGVTGGAGYYYYYEMFVTREGIMGQAWEKITVDGLTQTVKNIEFYKMEHGQYPKALTDLPSDAKKNIYDMEAMHGNLHDLKLFLYDVQLDGQTYYLFSRGPDGEAFTADDLFPRLDPEASSKFGYRQRPMDFTSLQSSPVPNSPALASAPVSSSLVWRTPADGLKESQQTQKPILYDITAEWCGPCHRLTSEVFENAECATRINQLFIPVRVLDRRREEGKNPDDIGSIESKYELTGFPTIVVQFPGKNDSKKLIGFYGKDGTMDFLNKAVQ